MALFEREPDLWRRVRDAVASALPEQPRRHLALKYPRFKSERVLGAGFWGFVHPTAAPRWVVKISCDEQAGQIASTLLSKPKLRTHPGICFMRAAWELPGYRVDTGSGHMPITITVREDLPDSPEFPDTFNEDFVVLSQLARRYNDAERLRREAVEYHVWDSARAYAEQRRADRREFNGLMKLVATRSAYAAPVDFLRKYLRATGEMLVDITRRNMGWRKHDTRDVGGHAPGSPGQAVIRDAEHTGGLERPGPAYLPNP